jgi:hypothetical protein
LLPDFNIPSAVTELDRIADIAFTNERIKMNASCRWPIRSGSQFGTPVVDFAGSSVALAVATIKFPRIIKLGGSPRREFGKISLYIQLWG